VVHTTGVPGWACTRPDACPREEGAARDRREGGGGVCVFVLQAMRAAEAGVAQTQRGVLRYNCADSLDRTNLAGYFSSVQILVEQCRRVNLSIETSRLSRHNRSQVLTPGEGGGRISSRVRWSPSRRRSGRGA
jgi:hypothetical protein